MSCSGLFLSAAGVPLLVSGSDRPEIRRVDPVTYGIETGTTRVARMLIERGADIADQTIKGQTLLHLAAEQRQLEVGRMLIGHGTDMEAQTGGGRRGDSTTSGDAKGISGLCSHAY
jgi:ankyrin repeat protein